MARKESKPAASKSGKKTVKKPAAPERPSRAVAPPAARPAPKAAPQESGDQLLKDRDGSFFVVGIGASAGGLEAFEQFFTAMPADSGMGFVLIPHLSPEHKSIMSDLLRRYTKMEIFEARDGVQVRPDRVYIIPPDKDMSIFHGRLQLIKPVERRGLRHPIDFFFRSLAADQGERAIAIILSGTGTEGALGLKDIKGAGGLVIAQDPTTARYDGMPRSATATDLVDYVLPPDKMPEQLLRYARSATGRVSLPPREAERAKPADALQKIFVLIRSQTGHDFSLYKHNTVMRRIERRMAVVQAGALAEYYEYLRNHTAEVETLFRELLIRVTNFFRDPEAFEALKSKALPLLFENKPHGHQVRIWAPGCSTGEEAYSLAIVFSEYMRTLKGSYKLQIFATDIDAGAIEIARAGLYSSNISVDVSPERLANFFIGKDNMYRVKEEIRELLVFATQNIIKDPPFSKLDMISCRNLLIYLSADLQKKVLPILRYSLNPGGILFLGSSESVGDNSDLFTVIDKKWKLYRARRIETPALIPLELQRVPLPEGGKRVRAAAPKAAGEPDIGELTADLLLTHYSPPCVVVDRNGDIVHVHGKTGKYLEPAAGKASLNVVEMAREGLRMELRTALRQVSKQMKDSTVEGIGVRTNGSIQMITLEVRYLKEPENLRGLMMVVFRDIPTLSIEKAAEGRPLSREKMDRRVADLEFELKSTREHLQTTIEELETSNEELQATNEELQSSNEELQSTNEELETSKEELQSTNEELMTVNSELQHKMEELSQVNNDMNNLLASTQIATIFLDEELKVKRFTPSATDVINLIQGDIGRPVTDIVSKLDYPELARDAAQVLQSLTSRERLVKHRNGLQYLTRIIPYRTVGNVIEGVVITFIEVQRKMQELGDLLEFSRGIVETVREPLLVLDQSLKVLAANRAFYETFKVLEKDTEGKLVYELGGRQWDIPALKKLLEEILPESSQFVDFGVEHDFPRIGRRKMLLNARRIERTNTILLAIEDVTGKK